MGLCELSGVPRDGADDVSGKVVGRHFGSFFVDDFKVIRIHNFLQAIECFRVYFAQFFERSVVCNEREFAAPEVCSEMVHAPDGSLHF